MRAARISWPLVLLALAVIGSGCGKRKTPDPRRERLDAARAASKEADGLLAMGQADAARELFQRAYDEARDALHAGGTPEEVEVYELLCYVAGQLGRWSPGYLGRAVRYAEKGIKIDPGWAKLWLDLGIAYAGAGLYDKAVDVYRHAFSLLPSKQPPTGYMKTLLIRALYSEAATCLEGGIQGGEPEIGAEGEARHLLEQAWALRPDATANRLVVDLLARVNRRYADEANAAIKAKSWLELVRVRSRFGYHALADEDLTRARNTYGRTEEVRWVEARYVEELKGVMEGDREAWQRAARDYLEMMGRGERIPHAAAGYGRAMLALGKGDEALKRLQGFPEPSADLRRTLILLRLARLKRLPPDAADEARTEYERIRDLLDGGLEPRARAELLLELGDVAYRRGDRDRLAFAIQQFQSRFRRDIRVVVLEAGLQTLRGAPIHPGSEAGRK